MSDPDPIAAVMDPDRSAALLGVLLELALRIEPVIVGGDRIGTVRLRVRFAGEWFAIMGTF